MTDQTSGTVRIAGQNTNPNQGGGFDPNPGGGIGRPGGGGTTTIELTGPIGAHYAKLGGAKWGVPLSDPQILANNAQYVSFREPKGRDFAKTIVWSARAGVHVVYPEIFTAWANYRGHAALGYPAGGRQKTAEAGGSWQQFDGSIFVHHPSAGAHEVHGPIQVRYTALGGSGWGYPTTDETITPDGRGRYNHFVHIPSGAQTSIYWTPTTGAWEVGGAIRAAWAAAGWEKGPLGYPTSGEQRTHDVPGRFQTFENGMIVWHPSTGAFAVGGAILAAYTKLGGSLWGYPVTDESAARDGGRFNHFREVESGEERSIYWTPATGAVPVVGKIRSRWAKLGWERSHLGYPVEPQGNWAENKDYGMQQRFQQGRLLHRFAGNVVVPDPIVLSTSLNRTGVRGELIITIPYGGKARQTGFVRATGLDSYDFIVNSVVTAPNNTAILFHEDGEIEGDLEPGPERYNFGQSTVFPIDVANFWDFDQAKLQIDKKFDSHLSGAVGDIVEGLVKWVVGATAIATPGAALLLLGGTAATVAITKGSVSSGLRVVGGTLFLAGPFGTVIALAATAMAELTSTDRPLTTEEYTLVKRVFGESLPQRENIRIADGIGSGGIPFTYPGLERKFFINVGKRYYDKPLKYGVEEKTHGFGSLLMHEMGHVWQLYNNAANIAFVADAIWAKVSNTQYPPIKLGRNWDRYGMEQQAVIIEEWFRKFYTGPGSGVGGNELDNFGLDSDAAHLDQAYAYISHNVRQGQN